MHLRRTSASILAALLLVAGILSGCSKESEPAKAPDKSATPTASTPKRGGTLRVGISRDVVGMDPDIGYGVSSASLQGNVYDTLVEFKADGSVTGGLAESWDTPDPKTYVFHLRKDVKWHDGTPFTAADVKFTLERVKDPKNKLTRAKEIGNIDQIETPDDYTVKVTLKQPYGAILDILAGRDIYMASKAWFAAGHDPVKEMMGTGPFKLGKVEPGSSYELVRNDSYWKQGLPYVDKLVLKPYQDDGARMNALRGGEVDFAEYVPWTDLAALQKDANYKLFIGYDSNNVVRINQQRKPFDDVRVRQALNYIIDRQAIIKMAFGGYGLAQDGSLLSPDHWAYNKSLEGMYKTNTDKAKQLLAAAGVDPKQVKFTITSSNLSYHNDMGQAVMAQLKAFGFQIDYKVVEVAQMMEKRLNGDYDLMVDGLGFSWPDPDSYSQFFETGGSSHAAGVKYSNKDLDALFLQGRSITDRAQRVQIYNDVQKKVAEDAPWMFVLARPQAEVMSKNVEGYVRLGAGLGTNTMGRMEYLWFNK